MKNSNTARIQEIRNEDQFKWGSVEFPRIITHDGTITSMEETENWVLNNKQALEDALSQTGAVLFRGFPLNGPEDFDRFVKAFDYPNFAYKESLSNAVRINVTDRVFTANEAPKDVNIYLHHEMAQTPIFPSKLFFYCDIAPEKGGATPLCRSDMVLKKLNDEMPALVQDFKEKGLKYTNVMPGENDAGSGQGRSWRSTLGADTHEQAEARLQKLGYSWEWLDNDCLKATTPVLPAVKKLDDGREVFFNQLIAAFRGWKDSRNDPSKSITFGDGTQLPLDGIQRVIELGDEFSFDVNWQKGDVALVDNFLAMHGRRAYEGSRKVLASLVA